jgi:Glycosyltransferase family 10 (fucosyltransferase) C-term
LLESVFSDKTFINEKMWKYKVFFNGESQQRILTDTLKNNVVRLSQIKNYDCILTGKNTNLPIKTVNLPLFIPYIYCNNYLNILKNPPQRLNVPKKNICAIISNSNCPKRNFFLEKLNEKIKIDYAGSYKNNVPRIPGSYNSKEIFSFYSQYKFVICMENTKQETYITEKIINGFLSNTIPIYWGSDKIGDYFNLERFINIENLNEKNINETINKILKICNNPNEYLNIVNKPILKNGALTRNFEDVVNEIKMIL